MTTVGIEMEFSDCATYETARALYDSWGRDFAEFEDRYGAYSKPKQNYSVWNCMSDGSLRNSDGTRSMWTYLDPLTGQVKKANASRKSESRPFWRGLEIQSPAVDLAELPRLLKEAEEAIDVIKSYGGVARRDLYDSMHVHLGLEDWTWEEVAQLPVRVQADQDELKKLATLWPNVQTFHQEEIDRLESARVAGGADPESWYTEYLTVKQKNGKLKKKGRDADGARRLVDVGPFFNKKKSYNTIEFRCFSSSLDIVVVEEQIRLAYDWLYGKIDNLPERVGEIVEKRGDLVA